jgi:hypothetical protein
MRLIRLLFLMILILKSFCFAEFIFKDRFYPVDKNIEKTELYVDDECINNPVMVIFYKDKTIQLKRIGNLD